MSARRRPKQKRSSRPRPGARPAGHTSRRKRDRRPTPADQTRDADRPAPGAWRSILSFALPAAGVLLSLVALSLIASPEEPPRPLVSSSGPTPDPWEYDATSDRHWHPSHAHWHDGPPPTGVNQPGAESVPSPPASRTGTPEPWEHDVANDRHWNPEHRHWHDGPPPSGENQPDAASAPSSSNPR